MAKYGSKAGQKVKKAMHERKAGTLKSGKSGKTVKSRKQAIAIGLAEARRAGAKVPAASTKRGTKKGAGRKKVAGAKKPARVSTGRTVPTRERQGPVPRSGVPHRQSQPAQSLPERMGSPVRPRPADEPGTAGTNCISTFAAKSAAYPGGVLLPLLDERADLRRQLLGIHRLREMGIEAPFQSLAKVAGAGVAGERNHRRSLSRARIALSDLARQRVSVLIGHPDVAHDHRWRLGFEAPDRRLAPSRPRLLWPRAPGAGSASRPWRPGRRRRAGRGPRSGPWHPLRGRCGRSLPTQPTSSSGSLIVNVDPDPGPALAAWIVPPCSSIKCLVMASPSPRPPCSRAFELSACQNFSNSRPRTSGVIPIPVSLTVTTALPSRRWTRTTTDPPARVNLIPFPTRLATDWIRRCSSPRTNKTRLRPLEHAARRRVARPASCIRRSPPARSSPGRPGCG